MGAVLSRDYRVDALRALAITLVVVGHAALMATALPVAGAGKQIIGVFPGGGNAYVSDNVFTGLVANLVYVFHMPLFAFLSGFVLWGREGEGPGSLLRKRFLSLMVPYFAWIPIAYVYSGSRGPLGRYVWSALIDPSSPGALWFLYAMFECFLVFAVCRWLPNGRWWLIGFTIVFAGTSQLLPYDTTFGRGYLAWILPFFVLGYFASMKRPMIDGWGWRGLVFSAGSAIAFGTVAWPVLGGLPRWWAAPVHAYFISHPGLRGEFALTMLGGPVARYGSAAAAVFLCYYLYGLLPQRWLAAQQPLGRRSLGVYATHGFVLYALVAMGLDAWPLVAIGALLGAFALVMLLERSRWLSRLLLGQGWQRSG